MDRSEHTHLHWQEIHQEHVLTTPIFDLVASRRRAEDGREGTYYIMNSGDWCNVIAETVDAAGRRCFVMVRQYRHGTRRVCLEFPGGVVDPGEDPAAAAMREFAEETGYTAAALELIGHISPNPALMNNRCHTFLAHGVQCCGERTLDAGEIIDPVLIPVVDLLSGMHQEEFDHAMMMVALGFYRLHKERSGAARSG